MVDSGILSNAATSGTVYAAASGKVTAYTHSQLFHLVAAIIRPLTANAERPIIRFSALKNFRVDVMHYVTSKRKKHPVGCFKIERRN